MTREQSIEESLRERRRPTLENLLRDVTENPGYHTFNMARSLIAPLLIRDAANLAEYREWCKVIKTAIRDKKIQRDYHGRFWLYGTRPPLSDGVRRWADANLIALLWWAAGLLVWSLVSSGVATGAEALGAGDVLATEIRLWVFLPVSTVWTLRWLNR